MHIMKLHKENEKYTLIGALVIIGIIILASGLLVSL